LRLKMTMKLNKDPTNIYFAQPSFANINADEFLMFGGDKYVTNARKMMEYSRMINKQWYGLFHRRFY
jgi:hypothetical protein